MSTTASAAYIQLADYNRRCREQAKDLPMQQDAVSYWSGVGFVLDGKKYVAPLDEVSEILSVPAYTRIPGARSWMKGVANVRGRLMTVMDLSGFLEKKFSGSGKAPALAGAGPGRPLHRHDRGRGAGDATLSH